MDITLKDIYQELQDLRKDLNHFKEFQIKSEGVIDHLCLRVENNEKKIKEICESLVGNVTAKTLKGWIIGAASVMVAVIAILEMLLQLIH